MNRDAIDFENGRVSTLFRRILVPTLLGSLAISAVTAIDGIFIGPFDLSICMGIPGQFDHPDYKAAVERIYKACRDAGKLCLIYTNTPEESRRYLDAGFDAVANNIDANIYTAAFKAIVSQIRG